MAGLVTCECARGLRGSFTPSSFFPNDELLPRSGRFATIGLKEEKPPHVTQGFTPVFGRFVQEREIEIPGRPCGIGLKRGLEVLDRFLEILVARRGFAKHPMAIRGRG